MKNNSPSQQKRLAIRMRKAAFAAKSLPKVLQMVRSAVNRQYDESLLLQGKSGGFGVLPVVPLQSLVDENPSFCIRNFSCHDGNVSPMELLAISAIVAQRQPQVTAEIGTFDGNTTLQIAANAPKDAVVFTIDLPDGVDETLKNIDVEDRKYVQSDHKSVRRYVSTDVESKVVQLYGDSATFDFSCITEVGRPDLIFIDGSHSYEYVKNDTEKMLEILAPDGIILWHDYQPFWSGVCSHLAELRERLPIVNIKDTTLAYYSAGVTSQPEAVISAGGSDVP